MSSTAKIVGNAAAPSAAFLDFVAALNMFRVDLAYDLRETNVKANSGNPGYTDTDTTGHAPGTQTVQEGARKIVRLAQLPENGPTASFSQTDGIVAW